MKRMIRRIAAPVAVVAGIGAAATAMQSTSQQPITSVDAQATAQVAPSAAQTGADALSQAFRNASRAALAGVVRVEVMAPPRQVSQSTPFGNPFEGTPFERFFRDFDTPNPMPRSGSGSGFIVSPDGYVLTNNHVVENATSVKVILTDRSEYEATVVGRDPNTDVAVLKIEGGGLPTVRLGDSDVLEVGDWVLALGYPLSLGETVTAGIVSAKGRSINIMRRSDDAPSPIEHFIQTDAAINPGNSGGPLVNLNGEVIGINTAIASPTGTYAGYGFAVPIKLAKRVADDLIEHGIVRRPKLGVQISDVTPADVDALGLPGAGGSVVKVLQDGPAKDAGMQLADVIVAVDGAPIRDTSELMERIAMFEPGDRVTLDVIRYGEQVRLDVRLGAFETSAPATAATAAPERGSVGQLGFAAAELTPALASRLGLRDSVEGVVITQVDPRGPAAGHLAEGMIIQSINRRAVRTVDDVVAVARELDPGETVSIVARLPEGEQTIVNYRLRR